MSDKLKARIEEWQRDIMRDRKLLPARKGVAHASILEITLNRMDSMCSALLFAVEGHGAVEYEGRSICSACSTTNVPTVMRIITPYPCNFIKGIEERFGVEL
jgi:hypothetical protein